MSEYFDLFGEEFRWKMLPFLQRRNIITRKLVGEQCELWGFFYLD